MGTFARPKRAVAKTPMFLKSSKRVQPSSGLYNQQVKCPTPRILVVSMSTPQRSSGRSSELHTPKRHQTVHPRTPAETGAWARAIIYLDTHMLLGVYEESGVCVRNHCGAEPPCDIEPSGLLTAVGGRDRASASYAATERVKAPASAARGRFRGIHGGCTAPSLPAET